MTLNANQDDSIISMWNYLSIHQLQDLRKLFLNTYQLHHLKKRSSFKEIDYDSWKIFMEKCRDFVDSKIHDEEEFEKVFHNFFHAVSTHPGYMNWTDLLNSLITNLPSRKKNALPIYHGGRYLKQHTKHEMIKKIICIKSGKTCVYIITSKHGCTGLYDEKFRLQKKYKIDIDSDPNSDFAAGSTDPGWITDAIWMGSSKHVVYSTSLRTMHFFDASASTHYEEYRAYGIKSIPTCMSFVEDYDGPDSYDILFFGDDSGGLTIVKFHQPKNALFFKDEVSSVQCIFWPDIFQPNDFASVTYHPNIHSEEITEIRFISSSKTIITISKCKNISLLIQNLNNKFEPYIFKLNTGVSCFDIHEGILITGSSDKLIRVWNALVTSKPKLIISGHKSAIRSVKIFQNYLISYSKDVILKVWDVDYGYCLQSLQLLFPGMWNQQGRVEQHNLCIYPETSQPNVFIVTCWEYFTLITFKVKPDAKDSMESTPKSRRGSTMNKEVKAVEEGTESKKLTEEMRTFKFFDERKKKLFRENSINVLKVKKYINNNRMKELAKNNMPFMALEVHEIDHQEINNFSVLSK